MSRHVSRLDVRQGCISNARQIAEQCRQNGLRAGVIVVIVPLDDQEPEYGVAVVGKGWPAEATIAALTKVQEGVYAESLTILPEKPS